jgi:hypothetical protein
MDMVEVGLRTIDGTLLRHGGHYSGSTLLVVCHAAVIWLLTVSCCSFSPRGRVTMIPHEARINKRHHIVGDLGNKCQQAMRTML